ncbi:HAD family hydrolase [Pelotomaculum propionicicum]|uniref:HAD family hydrolase n=1 Tax=Pelotomaculum propionicicum TaxID=258475 RepID=UPI003B7DD465
METEAVLFDLDGTLVDSLPLIFRTYRQVFDEMGIPWNESGLEKMIGLPLKDIGKYFTGKEVSRFEELYQFYYHRDLDQYTRLYPGTLAVLSNLEKRKIKLGIVTSKGKPGTTRTASFTGLDRFMDVIVTAHDVSRHKPDPEPLLHAVQLLGAQVSRTIYIGDSNFDILTGRNAGARTLGVTWGLASREELESLQPDGVLGRWDELLKYIK